MLPNFMEIVTRKSASLVERNFIENEQLRGWFLFLDSRFDY